MKKFQVSLALLAPIGSFFSAPLKTQDRGRGGGGGLDTSDTSGTTGRSGRQKAATRRNMRREERVTVRGPVKKQQPDGMSHGGGGGAVKRGPGRLPTSCNTAFFTPNPTGASAFPIRRLADARGNDHGPVSGAPGRSRGRPHSRARADAAVPQHRERPADRQQVPGAVQSTGRGPQRLPLEKVEPLPRGPHRGSRVFACEGGGVR